MNPSRKSRPWTADEDAALAAAWPDVTLATATIATRMSRTTASLYPRAALLKLPSRPAGVPTANSNFWTKERLEVLRAEFDAGTGYTAIGRKLGCTKNMALGKCMRMGWTRAAQAWMPKEARTDTHIKSAAAGHLKTRHTPNVAKPRIIVCGNNTALAHIDRPARAFMPKDDAWAAVPGSTPRHFAGDPRMSWECNWPLNDEHGAPMLRCCLPVERGGYCSFHAGRAYAAPRQPGKRAVNELIRANRAHYA